MEVTEKSNKKQGKDTDRYLHKISGINNMKKNGKPKGSKGAII